VVFELINQLWQTLRVAFERLSRLSSWTRHDSELQLAIHPHNRGKTGGQHDLRNFDERCSVIQSVSRLWLFNSLYVVGAAAAILAVGCEVGPNYQPPKDTTPAKFSEAATRPATQPSLAAAPTSEELQRWWETFHDPELNSLIDRAIKNNLSLQVAVESIIQARAQVGVSSANFYPTLNGVGAYSHSRRSAHLGSGGGSSGTAGTTGTTTTGGSGGGGGGSNNLEGDFYQLGFDSSWEIDVFGGTRRGVEAAQANLDAAIENRREVLITLLGDVATDYVTLRSLQREVAITNENIATQDQSLQLTETENHVGLVADLDVTQQKAQVLTTASALPDLDAQVHQTIHALSILINEPPGALEAELETPAPIPGGPPHVPPGLPSELLRRRPDIRDSERQLAAASANIGVAVSQLFPQFSLTGDLGYESSQFHELFNLHSRYFSIGPSMSWPIFSGGLIQSNIDVANAQERAAFYNYQLTVLTGLQEVDDELIAYAKEQDRRAILADAVAADQKVVKLTRDLYSNGLDSFLDVLTAQANLFAAETSLVQSDELVATDLVALYKALGGGWEVSPD
jgi:outer membrane protein, multidrug efflux system